MTIADHPEVVEEEVGASMQIITIRWCEIRRRAVVTEIVVAAGWNGLWIFVTLLRSSNDINTYPRLIQENSYPFHDSAVTPHGICVAFHSHHALSNAGRRLSS